MNRIGVITCQILELEFAHLLVNDPDVQSIRVVSDEFSELLFTTVKNLDFKNIEETSYIRGIEETQTWGLTVVVQVMKVGLHSNIPNLRKEVKKSVQKMAPFVDAIFLGYGLCGNAFQDWDDFFSDIPVPVSMPMEQDRPVDDCIGLIIGGRDNYYAEQCRCAGTIFVNAGFSRHLNHMLFTEIPERLAHKKDQIFRQMMTGYKRSLLLPTPVMGEEELKENSAEFNSAYKLKIESRPGTLALLQDSWETAKKQDVKLYKF